MSLQLHLRGRLHSFWLDAKLHSNCPRIAIVGSNGSGKTSLLRAMLGFWPLASGYFRQDDRVYYDHERNIQVIPEFRNIGYVPQGYALFPHLTVQENLEFPLRFGPSQLSIRDARLKSESILDEFEAKHLRDRFSPSLSGGEQQRVALARAVVSEPHLLLMDEPLAALDISIRRKTRDFLCNHLHSRALPTIWVTHDIRDILAFNAEIFVLEAGKVVQSGTIEDLGRQPINEFVAEFVQSQ